MASDLKHPFFFSLLLFFLLLRKSVCVWVGGWVGGCVGVGGGKYFSVCGGGGGGGGGKFFSGWGGEGEGMPPVSPHMLLPLGVK